MAEFGTPVPSKLLTCEMWVASGVPSSKRMACKPIRLRIPLQTSSLARMCILPRSFLTYGMSLRAKAEASAFKTPSQVKLYRERGSLVHSNFQYICQRRLSEQERTERHEAHVKIADDESPAARATPNVISLIGFWQQSDQALCAYRSPLHEYVISFSYVWCQDVNPNYEVYK